MKWGEYELHLISDGRIWLDGGAMFGVVPRHLWQKVAPPDARNRIPLGLNCLLIKTEEQNILIDTGCGYKYSDKELEIYRIEHSTDVQKELNRFGLEVSDIDIVINTHLHFDHCGGNTVRLGGEVVPAFPNAQYLVNKQEYEAANQPNERNRSSYWPHNWLPLEAKNQLKIVEGLFQVTEGVELVPTPGHTLGHQSVKITSGGKTLFYIADLCPTAAHLPLPWIMAYDLYPMTTLETRREIYEQADREQWLIFFEHEPGEPAAYLQKRDGTYNLTRLPWKD